MSAYTLFANAFLAVGGFVVALFAIFGALCFALRGYLAFLEWSFKAADKFWRECHRPTLPGDDALYQIAHGDWPALPSDLAINDVFHFGTDTTRGRNDHARR